MWVSLLKSLKLVPQEPGVYIIRWTKNDKPVSIPRILGVDEKGILYIGSANDLRKRLRKLIRGLKRPSPKMHTASLSYYFFRLHEHIKIHELEVSWVIFKDRREAEEQEWIALRYYADKYGEAPPLNRALGRKKFLILGITELGVRLAPRPDPRLAQLIG